MLAVARANRFAVPAYNISSNMLLNGAIEAAQEAEAPVIIAIHPDELAFVGTAFVAMALEMAHEAIGASRNPSRSRFIAGASDDRHSSRFHVRDDGQIHAAA